MNTFVSQISFAEAPLPLLIAASALVVLAIAFVGGFLVPGVMLWFSLMKIQRNLSALKEKSPDALRKIFGADRRLAHLWNQYQETLHTQTEDRDGRVRVIAIRSTTPADAYFNSQYVVDSRLHTEFFRHLPGIFTGVGIIGTFSGLILGLQEFQVGISTTPAVEGQAQAAAQLPAQTPAINQALAGLLKEVSTAFLVSAAAISLAMVVTFLEKIIISALYRRTEEISNDIDARFNAGSGEEYLSRIVRASEDSASQSKILKDALVNDLRDILRDVANSQIQASQEDSQLLARAISGSISDSLTQPMRDIAVTVKAASGDQSAMASQMLRDVLSSFSQQLNQLFGGQISGLNDLNRDTAQSVRDVAQTLNVLVGQIETASTRSGDMMAQRMAEAVESMERRQSSINGQTAAFVEQLRQLVATSQSETNQKMQTALAALGQQVGGMVDALKIGAEQSLDDGRRREEVMADRTTLAVTRMTGSVDGAVKEMTAASTRMQDAVSAIAQVTNGALDRMNLGADTLAAASNSFATAGERVSSAMGQVAVVSGKLSELTGAMTASASSLQQITGDYRMQREAVAAVVTELRTVVDLAKREASLTADVLTRIESATASLAAAQNQSDRYLQGVSAVLGEAHQAFADATLKTLDRANVEFHSKLAAGVALLSASIQELEVSLERK